MIKFITNLQLVQVQEKYFRFVVKIPDGFPLEAAGPVFCAGVTMYSPLTYWKVRQSPEFNPIWDGAENIS